MPQKPVSERMLDFISGPIPPPPAPVPWIGSPGRTYAELTHFPFPNDPSLARVSFRPFNANSMIPMYDLGGGRYGLAVAQHNPKTGEIRYGEDPLLYGPDVIPHELAHEYFNAMLRDSQRKWEEYKATPTDDPRNMDRFRAWAYHPYYVWQNLSAGRTGTHYENSFPYWIGEYSAGRPVPEWVRDYIKRQQRSR